ncbi:MAG: hypothetical protein ACQEQ0_00805 [Bacteroidota bacterium]
MLDKEIGNQKLDQGLQRALKNREIHSVFLKKEGVQKVLEDKDWKVIKNTTIKIDS